MRTWLPGLLALFFLLPHLHALAHSTEKPPITLTVELPPGTPHTVNGTVALPLPGRLVAWVVASSSTSARLSCWLSVEPRGARLVEANGVGGFTLEGYGSRRIAYVVVDAGPRGFTLVARLSCGSYTRTVAVRVVAAQLSASFVDVYLPTDYYGEADPRRNPFTLVESQPSLLLQLLGVEPRASLMGFMRVCIRSTRNTTLIVLGGVFDEEGKPAPIASMVLEPGAGQALIRFVVESTPTRSCVVVPLWRISPSIPPGHYTLVLEAYVPGAGRPVASYRHEVYVKLVGYGDILVPLALSALGLPVLALSFRRACTRELALAGLAGASLTVLSRILGGVVFRLSQVLGPFDWVVYGPFSVGVYYAVLASLLVYTRKPYVAGLGVFSEWLVSLLVTGSGNIILSLLWCLTTVASVTLAGELGLLLGGRLLPLCLAFARLVDAYADLNIYAYTYRLYYAPWYIAFYSLGTSVYAFLGAYIASRWMLK